MSRSDTHDLQHLRQRLMPTWGEILHEIGAEAEANQGQVNLVAIRDKYLAALHEHTKRSIIVYAVDMFNANTNAQIALLDMQG